LACDVRGTRDSYTSCNTHVPLAIIALKSVGFCVGLRRLYFSINFFRSREAVTTAVMTYDFCLNLMGLLQLRFEHDSSTIRVRFERDSSTIRTRHATHNCHRPFKSISYLPHVLRSIGRRVSNSKSDLHDHSMSLFFAPFNKSRVIDCVSAFRCIGLHVSVLYSVYYF